MDIEVINDQVQPPNGNKKQNSKNSRLRKKKKNMSTHQSENNSKTDNDNPVATQSKTSKRTKRTYNRPNNHIEIYRNGGNSGIFTRNAPPNNGFEPPLYSDVVAERVTRQSYRNRMQSPTCFTLPIEENIPERQDKQIQTDLRELKYQKEPTPSTSGVIPRAKREKKETGWTLVTKKNNKNKNKKDSTGHDATTVKYPEPKIKILYEEMPIKKASLVVPGLKKNKSQKNNQDVQQIKVTHNKQELKAEKLYKTTNNQAKTVGIDPESCKVEKVMKIINKNIAADHILAELFVSPSKNRNDNLQDKEIQAAQGGGTEKLAKGKKYKRTTKGKRLESDLEDMGIELPLSPSNEHHRDDNIEMLQMEIVKKCKRATKDKIIRSLFNEKVQEEISSLSKDPDDYQYEEHGNANEMVEKVKKYISNKILKDVSEDMIVELSLSSNKNRNENQQDKEIQAAPGGKTKKVAKCKKYTRPAKGKRLESVLEVIVEERPLSLSENPDEHYQEDDKEMLDKVKKCKRATKDKILRSLLKENVKEEISSLSKDPDDYQHGTHGNANETVEKVKRNINKKILKDVSEDIIVELPLCSGKNRNDNQQDKEIKGAQGGRIKKLAKGKKYKWTRRGKRLENVLEEMVEELPLSPSENSNDHREEDKEMLEKVKKCMRATKDKILQSLLKDKVIEEISSLSKDPDDRVDHGTHGNPNETIEKVKKCKRATKAKILRSLFIEKVQEELSFLSKYPDDYQHGAHGNANETVILETTTPVKSKAKTVSVRIV